MGHVNGPILRPASEAMPVTVSRRTSSDQSSTVERVLAAFFNIAADVSRVDLFFLFMNSSVL